MPSDYLNGRMNNGWMAGWVNGRMAGRIGDKEGGRSPLIIQALLSKYTEILPPMILLFLRRLTYFVHICFSKNTWGACSPQP